MKEVNNGHTGVQESKRLIEDLPEWSIVAAICEGSGSDLQAFAGEILDKEFLDDFRTRWSLDTVCASIGVSNAEKALCHHVVVKINEQIIDFGCIEI